MTLQQNFQWAQRVFQRYFPNHISSEEYFKKFVESSLPGDAVVLDAGCGKQGLIREYLSNIRFMVGADIDKDSIGKNIITDKQAFVLGSLEKLPFQAETFDLITCQWVVEHLKEPQLVINEFYRILKKGGRVVVFTSNAYNLIPIISKFLPISAKNVILKKIGRDETDVFPTYYRCNSVGRLQKMFGKSGFQKGDLILVGTPFYFYFSKLLFLLAIAYEKLTDISFLRFGKMYIVASFVKTSYKDQDV